MKRFTLLSPTRRSWLGGALAAATLALGLGAPGLALAGDYPDKPVNLVLGFGTGGVSDIIARTLAPLMEEKLGQRFVVQNMPGAGGTVAAQAVVQAGNDGYSLLNVGASGPIKLTLMPKIPYSQVTNFESVSPISNFGLVVVAAPDSKFKSIPDLVAYGKAHPGELNVGTVAVGSTQYLSAKLFITLAGLEATVVPYKSTPELMGGVTRGEVDVAFEIIPGAKGAIDNGQVVPIATTMATRSELFPDLPTVEEGGVAPYDVSSWNGYSAPNGVPAEVKEKINAAIQDIIKRPEVKAQLAALGAEPWYGTAADMDKRQKDETQLWHDVIIAAGVPIEG